MRLAGAVILLAAASGCGGCRQGSGEAANGANEPAGVSVEVARLQTLRSTVTGSGLIAPNAAGDWTIFAPETGRVAELPKAEGDAVQPGDLLARFEYGSLSADISAREAELATANGRLGAAQAQVTKITGMFDRGFAARAELEAAKGEVTAAELDIARLKQQLQAATGAAEHASVKARFAGVIAKKFHNATT